MNLKRRNRFLESFLESFVKSVTYYYRTFAHRPIKELITVNFERAWGINPNALLTYLPNEAIRRDIEQLR